MAEASAAQDPEEASFEVWEENVETVRVFTKLSTQWRYAPMGGVIGLNYPAVESVLRMLKIKDKAAMLDGLRVMEMAALEEMTRE